MAGRAAIRRPYGGQRQPVTQFPIPHFGDFAKSPICQNQFAGGKPAIPRIAAFHSPLIKEVINHGNSG